MKKPAARGPAMVLIAAIAASSSHRTETVAAAAPELGFVVPRPTGPCALGGSARPSAAAARRFAASSSSAQEEAEDEAFSAPEADAEEDESFSSAPLPSASLDPRAVELKRRLRSLSSSTDRGFSATRAQRDEARDVVRELARYNPSDEPAAPYYEGGGGGEGGGPTLAGKWTLIYTDAPDITSLSSSPAFGLLPPSAELGRIGQDCSDPPLIKNVIEWRRPGWIPDGVPFSGDEDGRVLQKVCTEGKSSPANPKTVELTIAGLDLAGDAGGDGNDESDGGGMPGALVDALTKGPGAFFQSNPVELRGPLSGAVPFGRFEILYLDEEMRVIETGQGYLAANVRLQEGEEWF